MNSDRNKKSDWAWMAAVICSIAFLWFVVNVAKDPFVSIVSGTLPIYVLKGKLFTEPFDIIHAGFTMDQPTIGKWMILFAALSAISFPMILLMRWGNPRNTTLKYWSFAVPVSIIGMMLLSILAWPFCMLIQYVASMGFTVKRTYGLVFCVAAFAALPLFLRWALRWPKNESNIVEERK